MVVRIPEKDACRARNNARRQRERNAVRALIKLERLLENTQISAYGSSKEMINAYELF